MANIRTFATSADENSSEHEFSFDFGSDVNDSRWQTIGYTAEDINEGHIRNVTITIQGYIRRLLKKGLNVSQVQSHVDKWTRGTRGGARIVVKVQPIRIDASDPKYASFSIEQLRAVASDGAELHNIHLHPSYVEDVS